MNASPKQILNTLQQSAVYRGYEEAFQTGLQLPLTLRPAEHWGLPLQDCRFENPFCAMMAAQRKSCAACLHEQHRLRQSIDDGPATITCFAGLSETLVPVRHQGEAIGYLQTGQVRLAPPTNEQFEKVAKQLTAWGADFEREELKEAYFAAEPIAPERYSAMVSLLETFADHLEVITNQIVVQTENAEPPLVKKAKAFLEENFAEEISLEQVARSVSTSTFYFCKAFKKATGLTFTEFLTRLRIEKAKEMLLAPHTRISEAAFAVGFQSLSQFNRAFKKIVGRSPTEYRQNLPDAMVA